MLSYFLSPENETVPFVTSVPGTLSCFSLPLVYKMSGSVSFIFVVAKVQSSWCIIGTWFCTPTIDNVL